MIKIVLLSLCCLGAVTFAAWSWVPRLACMDESCWTAYRLGLITMSCIFTGFLAVVAWAASTAYEKRTYDT
ncbi:MAG: hypothetical protein ACRCWR_00890 [Saezia sp.]